MAEIWAVARFDLGLSDSEVGSLNLLEYSELVKRKQANDDRARLNAGFIYAAILNSAWGDPNRRVAQPTDIVPSMCKMEEFDLRYMDAEKQAEYMQKVFSSRVEKEK